MLKICDKDLRGSRNKKEKRRAKTKKKPDRIPFAFHFLKASRKAFFKIMKNHKIIKSKKMKKYK